MSSTTNGTVNISLWEFKGKIEYVDKWFLMGHPAPVVAILLAYLAFVMKLGPAYMKHRPPFQLKRILVLYNTLEILIAGFHFQMGFRILWKYGLVRNYCLTDLADMQDLVVKNYYFYLLAKLTELLDTVFFVLRKKHSQVSFLHVYHHSVVIVCTWIVVKFDPSPFTIFFATANSFVHIVMYGYYALSAFPELNKYLWWKAHITKLQLVQFVLILAHGFVEYRGSQCKPTSLVLGVFVFNLSFMIVLFSNFYIKSYSNKDNKSIKTNKIQKDFDKNHEREEIRNGPHKDDSGNRKIKNVNVLTTRKMCRVK